MLIDLAYLALAAVAIWAAVELIKHLAPSYYDRRMANFDNYVSDRLKEAEKRLADIEAKFGGGK